MDVRHVSSYSFVICIVVFIVDAITVNPGVPTVPTKYTSTKLPIVAITESDVSKSYATDPSEGEDDFSREPDVEGAPPDHIVPYSEHENPEEPSTRNRATVKPEVELDFVPTKLYAQVRKTHTVKRLPRKDALKSATNDEEVLAAPRLREVVTKSKTNTVYTEEGYEDAAYDHGGHIRDADFQEDYAKKIGDPEETRELNDSENETEIQEGSEVEKFKDYNDTVKNHAELDRLWRDPSINPKQVTENEIARLEEDLENEYKESEKNAETEVPENLKNPYGSDEEDEEGAATEDRDGNEVTKKNEESASDELVSNDASVESAKNEILEDYVSKPRTTENAFTSSSPSVDYGKVFWDYFRSVGSDDRPDTFGEAKDIEKSPKNLETTSPEVSTTVQSLSGVHTAPTDFYSDFNFSPTTEFNGFISNRMDYSPSAASLYESWKRRDFSEDSEESSERDPESSESYVNKSEEEIPEADDFERNASALNLQNVQGSTTLIGPKKLSYTVIIRPSDKPRTKTCPCDGEAHERPGERTPVVKSLLREPEAPDAMNDFSNANDFTGMEAPLAGVPLRQVTYSDFLPHSYASVAHPSGKPEIVTNLRQIQSGEGERYELVKNSYVNHPQNLHPRYNRFRAHPKGPRQFYPITKLVPPSSISRSKYSHYQNVQSAARPIKKYDTISNFRPWPEILRFYRSIERRIFPRHRRSLVDENDNISSSSHAYKIIRDGMFDASSVKQLRLKRNLSGESNRLVEADNNAASEKSIGMARRLRRASEKLLHEAPRIVDEVIDGEIESRFKDDDDTETEEENDEKPENLEIEVPDFNFSDVTDNNESEKVTTKAEVRKAPLDIRKYPFYDNSNVPRASALKYITNPRTVPRKTLGGTEFYDSRDKYRECEEVKPDFESSLPVEKEEEEEDEGEEQQRGNRPRLHGLGESLDCFRAKYFDDDPLDNPLFVEKEVGQPRIPEELDLKKLHSRISDMSNVQEHQVARRVSEAPEPRESNRPRSRNSLSSHRNRNQMNREKEATAEQSRINENKELPRRHKIRKQRVQTTTKPPEILTTPYQHEVYEDVMGTIKNLAGLYETFGEPAISASSILPEESRALVTPRGTKVDFESIHITERPRGFMVQRLLSPESTEPPKLQRYRIIPYRTNKVSYRTRLRANNTPGGGGTKLGYFRTVTVHKRSVKAEETPFDSDRARSKSFPNSSRSRSNKMESDEQPAASERIVYTIRDRIRHSKPRGNSAGQKPNSGNLEASASETVRNQEPRNDRIAQKKVPPRDGRYSTIAAGKAEELGTATSSESPATSGGHDYLDEPDEMYKIQYSTTHGKEIEPNNLQRRNVQENFRVYDDEENVEGDVAKKEDPESKEAETDDEPEFYQLRKYLESDPPGYSEAFGDKSRDSMNEDPTTSYKAAESRKEAASDAGEEQDEENGDEEEGQIEKPSGSLVDKESSAASSESDDPSEQLKSEEKPKSKEEEEEEAEESEEEDEDETHSPLVEDGTASNAEQDSEKEFERFASRPYSPFESFEDSKYMDIGPRLSKPYFYHPSFSTLSHRRKKYLKDRSDEERSESDEKNSKYTFPWDATKSEEEDGEKSSEESLKVERYEYPWERRERLARERRKKEKERKERGRFYGFPEDEDDEGQNAEPEDASGTQLHAKRVYPWEHYTVPSKSSARKKETSRRIIDNEEMSSEHRPRFSSRYKTSNYSSNNDNVPVASSIERETKNGPAQLTDTRNTVRPNKLAGVTVTSTRGPPAFTVPSKKATRRRMQTQTISTTPSATSPAEPKRKRRIWPTATTTTRKPIVRRRQQSSKLAEESLGSGSQKDVIVIEPSGGNHRRRRPPISRSTSPNSSATGRTFRLRSQKTTLGPQQVKVPPEESTTKNIVTKNTTPKEKTTEHRSRFSKEEIITKTSYPGLNDNNNHNNKDNEQDVIRSEENGDSSDSRNGSFNETVRKVSIMTKETPEHIYRTEEIDKNGVKGKFVSITPNNGTNSSLDMDRTPGDDDLLEHEETREMLEGFANSEENYEEQDSGISSLGADSHILANLLMQVRPYTSQWTSNGDPEDKDDFSSSEGSGTIQDYEVHSENDSGIITPDKYIKDPSQRLYFYIED